MSTGQQEVNMAKRTTFSVVTDYLRMVIDGQSVVCSPTNFITQVQSLITSAAQTSKIREVATNAAINVTDNTVLADCTSGNISFTLPSPSSAFDATNTLSSTFKLVQKIDNGNSLTILPNDTENIYDSGSAQSSVVITGGGSVDIETDGTDWIVVGS